MDSSVSLLIFAFNEEKNIRQVIANCVSALTAVDSRVKIIVADDGSYDSTPEIVTELSEEIPYLSLSRVNENAGLGSSLARCIPEIDTDFFMTVPGDNDFSLDSICDLLSSREGFDAVIGYYEDMSGRSTSRKFLSRLFSAIVATVSGQKLIYPNGPGVYRCALLTDFVPKSAGFASIAELNLFVSKRASRLKQIQLQYLRTESADSKSLSLETAVEVAQLLVRIVATRALSILRGCGQRSHNSGS